ncbi:hypothetical protein PAE9249_01771 [Paenibacillus sp. CECT 9249]|uniref:hypothetical protein n=1 Tax=Paenibacillus sp. CECT 9249 TaxID=2845385 RepID=UPI001E542970|nr:hypothetical protein [Paenibacillus sp. CECT 9249]CAH0119272.1 hypothetical protein PAE9249_01771 [Paenibacillus sp. CECT 9249]
MELFTKPMSVGAILDRSFQLYRNHFTVIFLLMLLFFGPIYLLQNVLMYDMGGASFLPQHGDTAADSFDYFLSGSGVDDDSAIGSVVFILLLMPLYMVAVFPAAIASQLHLVRAAAYGSGVRFGELLRKSFSPYWRMVGNTFLYGLMMFGIYILFTFAVLIAVGFVGMMIALLGVGLLQLGSSYGGSIASVALVVVLYLSMVLGLVVGYGFFVVRFGFYLPVAALDNGRQTLRRSWRLTKGNFWRIFCVYFVVAAIGTVLMIGIYALLIAVFKMSLLGQLIYILCSLLIVPIYLIPYGVIYLDLRVRNEGADIERMLDAEEGAYRPFDRFAFAGNPPAFGGSGLTNPSATFVEPGQKNE